MVAVTAPVATRSSSRAFSIAASTSAASAGSSVASIRTRPASVVRTRMPRSPPDGSQSRCTSDSAPSSTARRNRRHTRSSCAPVVASAISTSRASFAAVATRVSARTLAYDSRPVDIASSIAANRPSARATRTFSRAAPGTSPIRHASHSAQLRAPCRAHSSD